MEYLYGAAVQGIQGFIFQTNELKDVVGASELVENICKGEFLDLLRKEDIREDDIIPVINAAGNIKCIFKKKEDCEKIVKVFPKRIVEYAPGITISQAVVEYSNGDFAKSVDELESKLRIQRNKPMSSTTLSMMGCLRSHKTNQPVMSYKEDEFLDNATWAKRYEKIMEDGKAIERKRTTHNLCSTAFGIEHLKDTQIAYNIEDIEGKNKWIAVIHADGNGLGQIVRHVGKDMKKFNEFSKALNEATVNAAKDAYNKIQENYKLNELKTIPIRPIVLGGDDFTVICRADFALEYARLFIENFEKNTKKGTIANLLMEYEVFPKETIKKLSACAGIAYIKSSFPFYYGYELAESLCDRAKKDAKKDKDVTEGQALAPSCIMFHKVQDSFVESFDDIAKRELKPQEGIDFEFGPYYLKPKEGHWTIDYFTDAITKLEGREGNALKSNLRKWIGLLGDDKGMADQRLRRTLSLLKNGNKKERELAEFTQEITSTADTFRTPVYDILAINTIMNMVTKRKEDIQ